MPTGQEASDPGVDPEDDSEEVHREEQEAWEEVKKDGLKEEEPVAVPAERTLPPND